jgi:hypothetical protein
MRIFLGFVFIVLSNIAFATPDFGPVDMGSFYSSLPSVNQDAKLGTLIKSEKIPTTIAGVQAWKIAYISSDTLGHKTLVTGIVAAPVNATPHSDRPILVPRKIADLHRF